MEDEFIDFDDIDLANALSEINDVPTVEIEIIDEKKD